MFLLWPYIPLIYKSLSTRVYCDASTRVYHNASVRVYCNANASVYIEPSLHLNANTNTACANSIQLCNKCSVNGQTLSVDCRYFRRNSHSIHLCRVYSLLRRMPNSVQMHHTFCIALLPHVLFTFAFRCKPGLTRTCM